MRRGTWVLRRVGRQIWFRAAAVSLAAILLALAAAVVGPLIPYEFTGNIGQASVGNILQIIASSMLAVTTFSLTAMVSAYSSATTLATPRATQLMIEDSTSQNALSTFLGAFLFSIVGIIALSTGYYGQQGLIILFIGTVILVLVIAFTLLRWISHITAFGRMADVIDRVERAASKAMTDFAEAPHGGAMPPVGLPPRATGITHEKTGYVTYVDIEALDQIGSDNGLILHVASLCGTLVHPGRAMVHVEGVLDDKSREAICDAFAVERHRSFDTDPRLGLIALGEIGSRALAPATNDAGTAIEVFNAVHRVLLVALQMPEQREQACRYRNVHMPRPTVEDLANDAFRPLIRDGSGEGEVAMRLQKTLMALADCAGEHRPVFTRLAERAFARAAKKLDDPDELADLRQEAENSRA